MGHIITRSLATRSLVERLRKEVFSLDLKSSGSYAAPSHAPTCCLSWSMSAALDRFWRQCLGADVPGQYSAVPWPRAQHLPPGSSLAGPGVPPDLGRSHLPPGNPEGKTHLCLAPVRAGVSIIALQGQNAFTPLPKWKCILSQPSQNPK